MTKKNDEVEKSHEPRSIDSVQVKRILAALALAPKGGIDLVCIAGNTEAGAFAMQLEELLIRSGWSLRNAGNQIPEVVLEGDPIIGLRIQFRSKAEVPERGAILFGILKSCGIKISWNANSEFDKDEVQLVVGKIPTA